MGGLKRFTTWQVLAALVAVGVLVAGVAYLNRSNAAAVVGQFQVRCQTDHLRQADPIVAPGVYPSAHMHEFFGNKTTNENSTYDSMVGQATSCSTPDDSAGYWTPTLIAPDGSTIRAKTIKVYYRGSSAQTTQAFPADLRMVSHNVAFPTGASAEHIIIYFPNCWDGVNLDSADHISHMTSVSNAKPCPAAFPVRVPAVTIVVDYPVAVAGNTLSSGALSTAHSDFWNTWVQAGQEALVTRCLNGGINCGRIDG